MPPRPAKKRKANAQPESHRGKTLDHFFAKKPAGANTDPAPPRFDGLTDEEYARKLAKEWNSEAGNASAVSKRQRSSSVERLENSGSDGDGAGIGVSGAGDTNKLAHKDTPPKEGTDEVTVLEYPDSVQPLQKTYTAEDPGSKPPPLSSPKDAKREVSLKAEEEFLKIIETIPMDTDPLSFDPDNYRDLSEYWPGGKATYGLLVKAFVLVNATKSRIKIVDTLVNLLRMLIRLDPESLLPAVSCSVHGYGFYYFEEFFFCL